ncbi:fructosamine kinase family protein [Pseudomarimonas arenosa]|uniref:Fructosamine kinase family protein n=1 Tax=Pseudomarimonas arenosa TaxID=2774145 RepID=A0AAW3ZHW7_9GAMM|nr:fructosamine kinase family protein [Pseudomarimonas arenosa]MBD8525124.1 fructosamine kinase family protein [Pseudomarimonas arenosa]
MQATTWAELAGLGDGLHRLRWQGQPAILKRRQQAPEDFFAAERRGLALLASAQALPTPTVLALGADAILLQDLGRGRATAGDWRTAGRRLAIQHRQHADRFGWQFNGWCGDSPQSNQLDTDGHRFFADQRLLPQLQRATSAGRLQRGDVAAIERITSSLPQWIPLQPASLLHGDLWLGNLHASANGELALIDGGAAHYGWAEAELAMLCLFGEPPADFFASYQEQAGIDHRWRQRAPLYNLYHLLNHLNLFGVGYLRAVREVLVRFA